MQDVKVSVETKTQDTINFSWQWIRLIAGIIPCRKYEISLQELIGWNLHPDNFVSFFEKNCTGLVLRKTNATHTCITWAVPKFSTNIPWRSGELGLMYTQLCKSPTRHQSEIFCCNLIAFWTFKQKLDCDKNIAYFSTSDENENFQLFQNSLYRRIEGSFCFNVKG